jgi:hypothetical protein
VDPYSIASGLLGDCGGGDGEPFRGPMFEIAQQLREDLRGRMDDLTASRMRKAREDVRPKVETVGFDMVENVGGVFATFLESVGEDLLDCESVASIKDEMLYPMCTSTVGALGWYLGCLYLMAWTLCCCALPAGCLVDHENTQRAREYDAYMKAFGDDRSDSDSELDDQEEEDDDDRNDKRMAVSTHPEMYDVDDEEGGAGTGAYGAVFGGPREQELEREEEQATAPVVPAGYYDDDYYEEDDGVELRAGTQI